MVKRSLKIAAKPTNEDTKTDQERVKPKQEPKTQDRRQRRRKDNGQQTGHIDKAETTDQNHALKMEQTEEQLKGEAAVVSDELVACGDSLSKEEKCGANQNNMKNESKPKAEESQHKPDDNPDLDEDKNIETNTEPNCDAMEKQSQGRSKAGRKANRPRSKGKVEVVRYSTRLRQKAVCEDVRSHSGNDAIIGTMAEKQAPHSSDAKTLSDGKEQELEGKDKGGKGRKRKQDNSLSSIQNTSHFKRGKKCVDVELNGNTDSMVKTEADQALDEMNYKSGSSCLKFVGAHTSIAGGLTNAIKETLAMGGRAFGMFLKSQRTWASKPLEDADAEAFRETLRESGILPQMVVPHGSYLLNCGSSDAEVLKKSRDALCDELKRCDKLGLPIYNFHPGSSKGEISTEDCIKKISDTINYAHSQTSNVITVVENMSGQGNTIGGKFSELRQIIDGVMDKSRIGVCLDTCHAFAAGYNIKTEDGYEQMKKEFSDVIGHNYLKAVHLNDSKGKLGCHQDRHENIGKGKLGLATFRRIMNDPFFDKIPMILETPECDYGKEINKLYGLCNQ